MRGSRGAALYEMLRAAARGEFGTLIIEDADRLSRDQSFLEEVCVCLDFLGITVHTPVRGKLQPTLGLHPRRAGGGGTAARL